MIRPFSLIALSVMVIGMMAGCMKPATDSAPSFSSIFFAIETVRKNKPVQFDRIDSLVAIHADSLQKWDSVSYAHIQRALADAHEGTRPHVQSQIISKTLQLIFFNRLHRALARTFPHDTSHTADLYECLSPTVLRRSEWIGKNRELDELFRNALRSYLSHDGSNTPNPAVPIMKDLLIKTYFFSVLYEFEGIEKNRGKDEEKCEEKEIEALLFLQIIGQFAAKLDAVDSLQQRLEQGYQNLNVKQARRFLFEAYPRYTEQMHGGRTP